MHSTKPYSNATFTKRVDHQAGSHRPPKASKAPRTCGRCGATYLNRRWVVGGSPRAESIRFLLDPPKVLCPACRMAAEQQFGGEVRLSGPYLEAHGPEIECLLRNETFRAAEDNPLHRILTWQRISPNQLTVRTTTEHLAHRLGRALQHAHDGSVHFEFSHENKFAHVLWTRDQ